jgi:probable rRNA maturation factor
MPAPERPAPLALRYRALRVDRADLRRLLRRCLESEQVEPGAGVGVVLAGGRLLRRLNRQWRGRDQTTDVLSFPYGEPLPLPGDAEDAVLLGEVVVSAPRCLEQAAEQRVDPGIELVRLVIHGTLHVLGYDHERARDRGVMEARERRLRRWAARSGIGPGLLRVASGPAGRRNSGGGRARARGRRKRRP